MATSIIHRHRQSASDNRKFRVPKCDACGARNIVVAGYTGNQTPTCPKCGAEVTVISSVRDCPHDPVHAFSEHAKCILERRANSKRAREVFPTSEIPHLWAHRAQASARNPQGNLFFGDSTIFSYGEHFPIARLVENKKAQTAVLFTTRTYSNTTSGHCSAVRSAIPPSYKVFNVSDVYAAADKPSGHETNLRIYQKEIEDALAKCARARSAHGKEYKHARAIELRDECTAYVRFFGLRAPVLPSIPKLDGKGFEKLKAQEAEKQAQRILAKKAEHERRRKEEEAALNDWLAGRISNGYFPNSPVALRIVGDQVQTSLGASFPVSHAKRGLALIRSVMSRANAAKASGQVVEDWKANGHTCKLGYYGIGRIEANGTVHAGCHVVPWASIERIAPQIEAHEFQEGDSEKEISAGN